MKLGKSLIITGLLFSSILGSVNVGSITAMAAPAPQTPGATPEVKKKAISIKYTDKDGNLITDGEFLASAASSVDVVSGDTTFPVKSLNLPENYTLVTETSDITITDVASKEQEVHVRNVPKETVPVKYFNQDGTAEVKEPTLPANQSLINTTKQVKYDNINIPAGYEFEKYEAGVVILTRINKSDVNIIFVDENNNPIGKTSSIKNKNTQETVSETEVTIPNGYTALSGQKAIIASAADSNKVNSYSAKIKVKKNAPTTSHAVSKPGKHGGYVAQRLRISFIDQDGNEVGFQQLNGKASFDTKISAPNGYSLVNANEANIKFDKSGNKDLKLKVTKNKPVSTMEEGIVTTNSGDFKHLYTIEGKDITNRGLSGDSKWYTDQYATINGEKMFRVATNEWVKATDVYK
ncbi:MucBP domain-containing protein [Companilactobacillus muriivasis]|uniref:MucBP domain-containing protein n=1 Tax=Companilactobacillus muriivasis TaxID=3081444 RepID=UPI0030C6F0DE